MVFCFVKNVVYMSLWWYLCINIFMHQHTFGSVIVTKASEDYEIDRIHLVNMCRIHPRPLSAVKWHTWRAGETTGLNEVDSQTDG